MTFLMFLYIVSYILHVYALVVGFMCDREGEILFKSLQPPVRFYPSRLLKAKSPFVFSWSIAQQKYFIVNIGISVNVVFLFILPVYLTSGDLDFLPVWKELAFNYIHIGTALGAAMYHTITLREIRNGGLGFNAGKNT